MGDHMPRFTLEINIFLFISSETPEMGTETFRTVTIVFSTPENLLVKISGAPGMKDSHFLSKNVFWENAEGYLRNGEC